MVDLPVLVGPFCIVTEGLSTGDKPPQSHLGCEAVGMPRPTEFGLGESGEAGGTPQRRQEGPGRHFQNRKWKFKPEMGSGGNRRETEGGGVGGSFFARPAPNTTPESKKKGTFPKGGLQI